MKNAESKIISVPIKLYICMFIGIFTCKVCVYDKMYFWGMYFAVGIGLETECSGVEV